MRLPERLHQLLCPSALPKEKSHTATSLKIAGIIHLFLFFFSSVAQSCPTLGDAMDSSVQGVLQARILEWVAFSLLLGIFPTQDLNRGLLHCRQILYQLSYQGSPWTIRRSNQSILKEITPEYSLEGLMLKLKLQYFGHLMRRTDSLEKTLMLGKIEAGGEEDDRG